jgi:hypothetical protein
MSSSEPSMANLNDRISDPNGNEVRMGICVSLLEERRKKANLRPFLDTIGRDWSLRISSAAKGSEGMGWAKKRV